MDGEFVLDVQDVIENIASAEVMSLFFPTFRKALVVDARANEEEGPMIRIMPMAASPQERLRSIRRLRPGFARLRDLTVIPWPRYVDSLVSLGIWEAIVGRVAGSSEKAAAKCEVILKELKRLEKAELAAVVLGTNYHTVWSARE